MPTEVNKVRAISGMVLLNLNSVFNVSMLLTIFLTTCQDYLQATHVALTSMVSLIFVGSVVVTITTGKKLYQKTLADDSGINLVTGVLLVASSIFSLLLSQAVHRDQCLGYWAFTLCLVLVGVWLAVGAIGYVVTAVVFDFCLDFRTAGEWELQRAARTQDLERERKARDELIRDRRRARRVASRLSEGGEDSDDDVGESIYPLDKVTVDPAGVDNSSVSMCADGTVRQHNSALHAYPAHRPDCFYTLDSVRHVAVMHPPQPFAASERDPKHGSKQEPRLRNPKVDSRNIIRATDQGNHDEAGYARTVFAVPTHEAAGDAAFEDDTTEAESLHEEADASCPARAVNLSVRHVKD